MTIKALVLGGVLALSASGAAAKNTGEAIVFASNRDGDFEIYVMRPDGTGVRQLTRNEGSRPRDEADDRAPAWSPDGRMIAFTSTRGHEGDGAEDLDIYVMNADGSAQRRITNNSTPDGDPDWTREGRLVFTTCAKRCRLVALDFRNPAARPIDLSRAGGHLSPDGRRVLLSAPGGAGYNLHSARLDGSDRRRLTESRGIDHSPSWSPDGKRIAFVSDRDRNGSCFYSECSGFNGEIYVMNADGSAEKRLTRHPGEDKDPTWSPDGKSIAFARIRTRDDDSEILVVSTQGGLPRALTTNGPRAEDTEPDWFGSR